MKRCTFAEHLLGFRPRLDQVIEIRLLQTKHIVFDRAGLVLRDQKLKCILRVSQLFWILESKMPDVLIGLGQKVTIMRLLVVFRRICFDPIAHLSSNV